MLTVLAGCFVVCSKSNYRMVLSSGFEFKLNLSESEVPTCVSVEHWVQVGLGYIREATDQIDENILPIIPSLFKLWLF